MQPRPKMILFDYGETLITEAPFNGIAGEEALLRHAVYNPKGYSAQKIAALSEALFADMGKRARANDIETHNQAFERLLYESLGIKLALTPLETEICFWESAAPGTPTEGIRGLLSALNNAGIRTGVISNISFSGDALAERINRLLPENRFEFILASSEYVYRKPQPILFKLALTKADLRADEVWYCGDNPLCDIDGAAGAGIYPVWYQGAGDHTADMPPKAEHLRIDRWNDLREKLGL